ncbi:hypothetical protein A2774_05635 [Candidatus Roizmanbacteria bacterium RIFCSPHIGHO2_01_FULL_39_12c]|uniref:Enoyl reductase (ER) domain-containing protein n=1 Tax=Candidatus Roizmanbacteria bacterium RIFCSPHIGHO2_01_FULL_39_12c TaxID=1802031 RepID=A0A1F7GF51_9BACT|nr:MAG: hypothetical protein A2774_05635 [Candidatus Roizmanbacteria bacterium RIFCSPHIGHO2_01_FULL_39_12c]
MRAVQINKYGRYDVLQINENVPIPKAGEGKVLVKVKAVSINPFDYKVRSGMYKEMMPVQFPSTVGGDFAGVVKEVGKNVGNFKVGDEVYGTAGVFSGGSGAFAEYAVARVSNVSLKPKNTSFEEAAALPLVGSSTVQALEDYIRLKKGDKILIQGGAGGIGHIAIQLAKTLGAYIATTVSADDIEFVKQLGADQIIDYKLEKFEEKVKDFNAVFDTVGGGVTNRSIQVVKKSGILVSMINQPDVKRSEALGIKAMRQGSKNNSRHLKRVAELVEAGKVKVNIAKIFSLDQAKEAFRYQEESSPRGKVVLRV